MGMLRRVIVLVLAVVVPAVGLQVLPASDAGAASPLPPVPSPPAPVDPAPWYSVVSAPGPTQVSGDITVDTVWGPQGSPYVLSGLVRVQEQAALTMLPGTVVKMASDASLSVSGQLLVLGEPGDRVVITSVADDSAGGDTNGNGSSEGVPGSWKSISINPGITQASLPPSVIDYATIRFGGVDLNGACGGGGMLKLGEHSRAVISNSEFTDSGSAGISGGPGETGYVGVYDNYFARSKCGVEVSMETGDMVGNHFDGAFDSAAVWFLYGTGRFWFNDVEDDVVFGLSAVDVRFNSLTSISSFGSWNQQLASYSSNWWGRYPLQLPGGCMSSEEVAAFQPPITGQFDPASCPSYPNLYTAGQWRVGVLPALKQEPQGLPDELTKPYAARYGAVDTFRGTLTYAATDIEVADAGQPLVAGRVFRQDQAGENRDLGPGWRMSYTETLDESQVDLGDGTSVPLPPCEGDEETPREPGVVARCVSDADETTLTTADAVTYVFGKSQGELRRMEMGDPGHVVTLGHSGGVLSQVVGTSGRSLTYTRNGVGDVSSVADSQGRSVGYGYDTSGRLVSVTGVDGETETYEYTGGKLSKVTSAEGVVRLEAGFNGQGRVEWVKQDGQGRADIAYLDDNVREITQADDSVILQKLDDYGRLVTESVDGGPTSHLVYDGDGRLVASIPGVPREPMTGYAPPASMIQYDADGNVAVSADGLGRTTRVVYNGKHRPLTVTSPDGGVAEFSYDAQGRLTSVLDPVGEEWLVDTNGRGQVTEVTDPAARVSAWTFEPDGDAASETNELGGTTTFENTPEGWMAAVVDPVGRRTEYDYTAWGEVTETTSPRGGVTTQTFDADRNPTTSTDPLGEQTTVAFDTQGRMTQVTDALGHDLTFDYDVMGRLVSLTDQAGQVYGRGYSVEGWVTSTTAPGGVETLLDYDPAGRPTRVEDPLGRVTQTVYNRGNDVIRVDFPDGGSESFGYDAGGRQNSYTTPLGGAYTATYDAVGNQLILKDPLGKTEQRSYDALGRLEEVTDPLGHVTTFAYTNSGRTTTLSDAVGLQATAVLDVAGQLVSEVDGEGAQTSYGYNGDGLVNQMTLPGNRNVQATYDLAGRLTSQTDPEGGQQTLTYDALGRVTEQTYPDTSTETFAYDVLGNSTSYTNRTGDTWTYGYDALGRMTSQTDPLGKSTVVEYNAADEATKVTDPTGVFTRYGYDAMGRPAVISDNTDAATVVTYDPAGNPLSVLDPLGRETAYSYDGLGQLLTETYPGVLGTVTYTYDAVGNLTRRNQDGKNWTWAYDARDRVSTVTNPLGKATGYGYDLADRVTTETLPSGRTTSYSYTPAGELAATTDPGGLTSTYSYDPLGNLTQVQLPGSGTYDFGYDTAGNLATQTDPLGNQTSYDIDPEGRLLSTTAPSGTTVSSTYDPLGREVTRTSGATTRGYTYDDAGRLTGATTTQAGSQTTALAFTYNTRGLLASSSDTAGATTYQWDAAGQPTSITPPTGGALDFTYNAVGDVASIRGSVNLDYAYNKQGWLTSRTQTGATSNATTTYTYDNAGRPLMASINGAAKATWNDDGQMATSYLTLSGVTNPAEGTTTYTRDQSGRLTDADRAPIVGGTAQHDTYTWDDNSNRTQTSQQTGTQTPVTTNTVYDDAGRLVSATTGGATTTYSYNTDGQLTGIDRPGAAEDVTYTYDAFGELTSAHLTTPTTATTITYTHDALGRVTTREQTGTAGTTTTGYGYRADQDDPVSITKPAGTTDLVRDPTGHLLSAVAPGGATAHAVANIHGDLTAWRSQTDGKFTSVTTYDPFGAATTTPGPGTGPGTDLNIGFQSDLTDPATGLVDMNARAYDPHTGRFTSHDTVIGDLTSPASLNRYGYGNANPTDFTDPTGRSAESFFRAIACKSKLTMAEFSDWLDELSRSAFSQLANVYNAAPLGDWWNDFKVWVNNQDTTTFHEAAFWLGGIPGAGDVLDIADGVVYLAEGDYVNAAFAFFAAVPFIGTPVSGALRVAYRSGKVAVKSGAKASFKVGAGWSMKVSRAWRKAAAEAATASRRGTTRAVSLTRTGMQRTRTAATNAATSTRRTATQRWSQRDERGSIYVGWMLRERARSGHAARVAKRGPAFADTDLLVQATRGHSGALRAIRGGDTYVTPNQFKEFIAGGAGRRAFLEREGIRVFTGPKAGAAARGADFQKAFGSIVGAQGRGDAALAGFARAMGWQALTMDRRLYNYITQTLRDPSIPIGLLSR